MTIDEFKRRIEVEVSLALAEIFVEANGERRIVGSGVRALESLAKLTADRAAVDAWRYRHGEPLNCPRCGEPGVMDTETPDRAVMLERAVWRGPDGWRCWGCQ